MKANATASAPGKLMMTEEENQADTSCCATCGKAEIDDIKLKDCDGCDLVRYCSDACRQLHRQKHAGKCRKRVAELRDELLFKQPESSDVGDCPICSLPMPFDHTKGTVMGCCSKLICGGCDYANQRRQLEMRLDQRCPFCREHTPRTDEEYDKLEIKRIEANDPMAMCQKAANERDKGNHSSAFEYWTKAAALGDAQAHYMLADLYNEGEGVENDEAKYIHHLEEAAIGGHPGARYFLGFEEWNNNVNTERAAKHWMIAAKQGHDASMKELMEMFKEGFVEKEDLATALRAHKAALDATKSPQREAAEKSRGFTGVEEMEMIR